MESVFFGTPANYRPLNRTASPELFQTFTLPKLLRLPKLFLPIQLLEAPRHRLARKIKLVDVSGERTHINNHVLQLSVCKFLIAEILHVILVLFVIESDPVKISSLKLFVLIPTCFNFSVFAFKQLESR